MTVLLSDQRADPDALKTSWAIRQAVRQRAVELGFNLVDQTKIVTAASELARNTASVRRRRARSRSRRVEELGRRGLRLTFEDDGPGIADIELAMKDGFTTARRTRARIERRHARLSNEFPIESAPGQGTRVTITRWR